MSWRTLTLLVLVQCSVFLSTDGQILKAPPKVIYRLVGSDVVLSWCIQNEYDGFKPESIFYLKTPLDITVKERAIASIDRNGKIQILPDKSRYESLFSPRQINVTETNCVIDGGTNDKLRNFSLIIRNLSLIQGRTFKFQGDYIIKKVGRDNETCLKILEPPTFLVKNTNENKVIREGKTLSERCSTVGELSMIVKWFKDGVMLTQGINSSILILKGTKRSDNGTYRCSATNELVKIQRWFNLSVLYPVNIIRLSPSSESFVGQTLMFNCFSDGNPKPTYYWLTPNRRGNYGITLNDDSSTLRVKLNNSADFGNYTCLVNNSISSDNRKTLVNQLLPPGKVILVSNYTGVHEISVKWKSPDSDGGSSVISYNIALTGGDIDKDVTHETKMTSFRKTSLVRNTRYTFCIQARNIVGNGKERCINLTTLEEGPPGRPTISEAKYEVQNGDLFIRVSWGSVGQDVTGYLVQYRQKGNLQDWKSKMLPDPKVLTIVIGSVEYNVTYEIRVIAENEHGRSLPSDLETVDTYAPPPTNEASSSRNTGVIAGSVVAGTIVVIIAIVLLWRYTKRRTQNGSPSELDTSLTKMKRNLDLGDISNEENAVFDMERISKKIYELPESDYENLHQKSRIKPNEKDWELRRENIKIEKIVGKGSFGQVAKGILMIEDEDGEIKKQIVAVKMTKDGCSDSDKQDLLSELNIMKCLPQHANVIQLLGYVTRTEPLLVVISFVPFGDLLGYLRKSRGKDDRYFNDPDIKPKTNLTSKELIRFARDVACGMEFLALNKVVHRDLAARNVLVGEELVCKITDFGMARDVYQDNIYTKTSRGRIPVKWTAYESLMYNKYTTQSDVWSYGIVLFEIFTIGGTPYPKVKGRDVYSLLKEGYRIEKPSHVDNELYSVMLRCWETKPEERPSFSSLKKIMKEMERKHEDYVNLREYNSSLYENIEDFE